MDFKSVIHAFELQTENQLLFTFFLFYFFHFHKYVFPFSRPIDHAAGGSSNGGSEDGGDHKCGFGGRLAGQGQADGT